MKLLNHPIVNFVLCVIIAATFIYASIHKIIDPENFANQVAQFEILPPAIVSPFAYTLPILELITGILIFYKKTKYASLILHLLMMISFIIAIGFALLTGKNITCGCFNSEEPVSITKLALDAVLLVIIIRLLIIEHTRIKTETL